ncbi:helix-turn-helix domain-containing protein [Spirochaeta cellobiosiphila]|uniref:helix-turn-helix domain-containing protein n=1 Tax=Spirochaeta cellobiosiphila TaxID=504483 RepID=UPI0003F4BB8D|nr:AraC family transcriptional regulator [Spirochaeta cellobiosiphila]
MQIQDVVFVYQMKDQDEISWHSRSHSHDQYEYEVHYFIQGRGSFVNAPHRYTISPGSLFLTRPGTEHSIIADDVDDPVSYYALLFNVEPQEEVLALLTGPLGEDRIHKIGTNYRFFFEEIKEKGLSTHPLLKKSGEFQFLSFLFQLSDGLNHFHYGSESNHHIEKALRILQNAVMDEMTLVDLAAKLKLSEAYLVRLFKKKMAMTPMKYYRKLKIEAAISMLVSSDMPIFYISQKLHFYSEFHFSKVFKQLTGLSPSHYRKKYYQVIG